MKLFRITSFWTALRALAAWPLLIIGVYMGSAWAGSSIGANNAWKPAASGIDIFVETNGVHVSIIVPMSAAGEDLSDLIRPEHLTDPNLFGTHAMIGWGHAGVYRNARTWADVRAGDIAAAIAGSDDTLLHVYHLIRPQANSYRKKLRVSVPEYRQLIRGIRNSFQLNSNGQSTPYPAYGPNNIFYKAHGHYSAITTCNEWSGRILRDAGIGVGRWTPMPGGVMKWF
ncbi:DUF2459 domain-containing protein [Sphingorhabdus arenilitoris]|uniref:DUF2459 domain-containing protein n=1 Tax=Sphingorhabdus arenilitoris TaxID=1490041 RepID=A0ABV8RGC2_9SPHN